MVRSLVFAASLLAAVAASAVPADRRQASGDLVGIAFRHDGAGLGACGVWTVRPCQASSLLDVLTGSQTVNDLRVTVSASSAFFQAFP